MQRAQGKNILEGSDEFQDIALERPRFLELKVKSAVLSPRWGSGRFRFIPRAYARGYIMSLLRG